MKNNAKIEEIVARYQLELLLLFGSRASDKTHKDSDFDVGYLSKTDLTLTDESRLIIDLAPVFGSENIDLVNLKAAPPLLLYAATSEAKILFAKDDLIFPSLRAYAFKIYIESQPLYKLKEERLLEKLKIK